MSAIRKMLEPWGGDEIETYSRFHPRFQLNNNNLLGMAANELRRLASISIGEDVEFTTDQEISRWPLVTEFTLVFKDERLPNVKCYLRPEASPSERQMFSDAIQPLLCGLHRSTSFPNLRQMAMHLTTRLNEQQAVTAGEDMPYFVRKIVAERSSGFVNYTLYFNHNGYPYVQTFQVRGTKVIKP